MPRAAAARVPSASRAETTLVATPSRRRRAAWRLRVTSAPSWGHRCVRLAAGATSGKSLRFRTIPKGVPPLVGRHPLRAWVGQRWAARRRRAASSVAAPAPARVRPPSRTGEVPRAWSSVWTTSGRCGEPPVASSSAPSSSGSSSAGGSTGSSTGGSVGSSSSTGGSTGSSTGASETVIVSTTLVPDVYEHGISNCPASSPAGVWPGRLLVHVADDEEHRTQHGHEVGDEVTRQQLGEHRDVVERRRAQLEPPRRLLAT